MDSISDTCATPYEALIDSVTNNDNNPIVLSLYTSLFVAVLVFVTSSITKNYSQVDKLWSIVPAVYAWMAVCDRRTLLMALVISVWAVRLTWNFHRRGGYGWPPWTGDEDYRWSFLQQGVLLPILKRPWAWVAFNAIFISWYQNFLLWLIATPSLVAWSSFSQCSSSNNENDYRPLQFFGLDGLATALILFFTFFEGVADNQQWNFRQEKSRLFDSVGRQSFNMPEGQYKDGFCQSGLFALVRKPNYMAEQAIWVSYYLFSIASSGKVLNWSMLGIVSLLVLFQGSGYFTELITLSRYPQYKRYMQTIPLYVPSVSSMQRFWNSSFKKEN